MELGRHGLLLLRLLGVAWVTACTANPVLQCEQLENQPIYGVQVNQARSMLDDPDLPNYCQLQGTIEPNIGFEARLPINNWNGKFFQSGCGGYCGSLIPDKPGLSNSINVALKRGYATITTDGGHKGGPGDASWAENNPEAISVYAHKSIPLTYEAGVAMVQYLYGQAPDQRYFSGCSNGGRMAAMAAQRYPALFDGILGGSGVLNLSESGGIYGSWVVQANSDNDGNRILTQKTFAEKLPLLEQLVARQCDLADGSDDGLVREPRRCVVDIDALPDCAESTAQQCFTVAEKKVLRAWYQGPQDSKGRQLFPGMPPGSERFWKVWFLDGEDRVALGNGLGGDYAKYLGFGHTLPADYSVHDFDFNRDPQRLAAMGEELNATNPDLRAFRDAGGKFLMWHGWADPLVLPDQSVSYYEQTVTTLGGLEAVHPFFRLFMIPGHGHCWEIPAASPDDFDPLAALEAWVERNDPPDHMIANGSPDMEISKLALCPHPQSAVPLSADNAVTSKLCSPEL